MAPLAKPGQGDAIPNIDTESFRLSAFVDLLKRGIPPERVFLSLERRMRCGVAQCGHCFLGPKFVCQDGPVFRYPQLYGLSVRGV
jgi:hypothetical protein